ncbi:hypothetical protein [Novosphingobium sp.]|uniref:DUF7736 domain-containing protein n=1 Tax=Novosphingobium sp. TaxID=1874826 RepID=UPI0031D2EAAA
MQGVHDEVKRLDPLALASLTTGVVLCNEGFGPVSEAAEWVLGYPVYTHEFIVTATKDAIKQGILAQFPAMPTVLSTDWQTLAGQVRADFGDWVEVRRGTASRDQSPIESLAAIFREKANRE